MPHRRALLLLAFGWCLALLLVLHAPQASSAAAAPPFVADPAQWSASPAAPAAAPQQAPVRAYLAAVLVDGPQATIGFGTGSGAGGLTGEASAFAFGLGRLYYRVDVPRGAGQPFREEWTVNGVRRPELDRSGSVPATSTTLTSAIALSTGNPLPRGSYQLRFVVGGIVAGEAQARIE